MVSAMFRLRISVQIKELSRPTRTLKLQGKEITGEGLVLAGKVRRRKAAPFLSIPTRIGKPRCGEEEHSLSKGAKGHHHRTA